MDVYIPQNYLKNLTKMLKSQEIRPFQGAYANAISLDTATELVRSLALRIRAYAHESLKFALNAQGYIMRFEPAPQNVFSVSSSLFERRSFNQLF